MEHLQVCISARKQEAEGIVSLELRDLNGQALPAFTAGSHIDVHIAPNLTRQYSLFNSPDESDRYCIAVLNQPDGRGGSKQLHQQLHAGDEVTISAPRNAFKLEDSADHSVLIAGGIGITPIMSMAHRLHREGRSFELHYCVRTSDRAAFTQQLKDSPFARQVVFYVDDDPSLPKFNIRALGERYHSDDEHLYVCGPGGFMDHVLEGARGHWEDSVMHTERFTPGPFIAKGEKEFTIKLARSHKELSVPANKSILNVLQESGMNVPSSCEQGVCGTCIVNLLDGQADHRDTFLTDQEHDEGLQIAVCCSRASGTSLTLDL